MISRSSAEALYRSGFYVCLAFLFAGCGGGGGAAAPAPAMPVTPSAPLATAAPAAVASRITNVTSSVVPLGTFAGVAYARTLGTVSGLIDPREPIVGLASVTHAPANFAYSVEFEIIAPASSASRPDVVFVDAENRGSPASLSVLDAFGASGAPSGSTYPAQLGNGFLERHATAYARIQWQTGIAAAVPATAQGVGLVIERDFARMLLGRTATPATTSGGTVTNAALPLPYTHAIFGGISQSAWLVNDLIAEGFNADPVTGARVFDAAIAVDGAGNWLAINSLGANAGVAQQPYLAPNGRPLAARDLLKRPATDPFYVDTANYSDFYRLRASYSDVPADASIMRRYDWPAPHAAAAFPTAASLFSGGCNGGVATTLNPIGYAPYLRAVLLGTERRIGAAAAQSYAPLPPSATFALQAAPSGAGFNPLPGVSLAVPQVDGNGIPIGGVRFADSDVPLGNPSPPSIGPVSTASITATCGNLGGFIPFTPAQLSALYGGEAKYLSAYDAALQRSIASGYVLAEDESGMDAQAKALYEAFGGT